MTNTEGFITRARFRRAFQSLKCGDASLIDDIHVLQFIVQHCDREVRVLRKSQSQSQANNTCNDDSDRDSRHSDWTWQLSVEDFQSFFERGWQMMVARAKSAAHATSMNITASTLYEPGE